MPNFDLRYLPAEAMTQLPNDASLLSALKDIQKGRVTLATPAAEQFAVRAVRDGFFSGQQLLDRIRNGSVWQSTLLIQKRLNPAHLNRLIEDLARLPDERFAAEASAQGFDPRAALALKAQWEALPRDASSKAFDILQHHASIPLRKLMKMMTRAQIPWAELRPEDRDALLDRYRRGEWCKAWERLRPEERVAYLQRYAKLVAWDPDALVHAYVHGVGGYLGRFIPAWVGRVPGLGTGLRLMGIQPGMVRQVVTVKPGVSEFAIGLRLAVGQDLIGAAASGPDGRMPLLVHETLPIIGAALGFPDVASSKPALLRIGHAPIHGEVYGSTGGIVVALPESHRRSISHFFKYETYADFALTRQAARKALARSASASPIPDLGSRFREIVLCRHSLEYEGPSHWQSIELREVPEGYRVISRPVFTPRATWLRDFVHPRQAIAEVVRKERVRAKPLRFLLGDYRGTYAASLGDERSHRFAGRAGLGVWLLGKSAYLAWTQPERNSSFFATTSKNFLSSAVALAAFMGLEQLFLVGLNKVKIGAVAPLLSGAITGTLADQRAIAAWHQDDYPLLAKRVLSHALVDGAAMALGMHGTHAVFDRRFAHWSASAAKVFSRGLTGVAAGDLLGMALSLPAKSASA